ncbi:MFS transporter [Pseudomonas putida]|uniref:MFS transporter n=1 Tax=Pseudomonas putida TaxID=303 RepID=UPI001576EA28|nr:MFS transporter [Pseudomonas putida]NTY90979.1 MFS transporter [Pseudomonas putida]NTZ00943.1 MFS transporter [Pseudomonas putida]NTZ22605.1 MFS transporter [Pseudomonas putida]NTZ54446.1 MFS transporter [Pseudomonas putida]NTZ65951.1 MFS transporter [Pseudomonas putida]
MRKVSRRLLGFLFLCFVLSFLDRINIGFAGLTMMGDLGLSSTQFGMATTLFYIAYIACGIPSNMALAKVGARKWIGSLMIAWGLASTATLFATDASSLYLLRILVGITEAGFLPGVLLYLTFWFPAAYRARANALFMIAMPFTAGFGSALSGLILGLDGVWGLHGWQWLFLLEGMPSVIMGFVVFGYLNDTPQQARWLSREDKQHLQHALAADNPASNCTAGDGPASLLHEMLSPTVLMFSLVYFCLVNTLAMIAVWTPLIIKSISAADSSNSTIGFLAMIPQVCTIIGMVVWGLHSDRSQERKWHLVLPMLMAAAGWMFAAYAGNPMVQLCGICMAATGSYTAMSIFWTTPDQALTFKARAIGIAVINAFGNTGSALNPLVVGWLKDLTQSFTAGIVYAAVLLVIGALLTFMLPLASPASVPKHAQKL